MSDHNLDYRKDVFSISDIFIMMAVEVESYEDGFQQNWFDIHKNLKDVYDTLDKSDQDKFDDIVDDVREDASLLELYKEYRKIVSADYEPRFDECSLEMVKNRIENILGRYFDDFIS